ASTSSSSILLSRTRCSTPLPYTTLFRSQRREDHQHEHRAQGDIHPRTRQGAFAFDYRNGRCWFRYCRLIVNVVLVSIPLWIPQPDRKSTRLNSSHVSISYAVFCLKKKTE